ncbi:hypothetical protein, partial [Acidithiobacillus sp.]|uniref:hypothetical protein n=1 Tax=Acidithiobacillus sp. TaxID=1872118 RepID=UPI003D05FE81
GAEWPLRGAGHGPWIMGRTLPGKIVYRVDDHSPMTRPDLYPVSGRSHRLPGKRQGVMMTSPIVVFDLDGVLLDFESAWAQCAAWELGRPVRKVSEAYDLQERFALSAREWHRVWTAFHRDAWWERVPTHDSAWDTVCALEDRGASIWAVTNVEARWSEARAISLGGLIPSGRIVCMGEDASPHDRAEMLNDLGAQAFVDDQSPNVNAAVGAVAVPVLLHRNYREMDPPAHGVTVIDDLGDFPETLHGLISRLSA